MTSTSVRPPGYRQSDRDPSTAAMLSLIPGIGQLYNGESRKGMLFLTVAGLNMVIFLAMCFTQQILEALWNFGVAFHVKPNRMLVMVLSDGHMGSAVSLILVLFFISFIAYSVRDAYDHAAMRRRRIYPDMVIELPEATSGSYIFHFSFMLAMFILAFFFIIPPLPKAQITDIEFIQNQPEVKQRVKSHRKAEHNSVNAGKHEPRKPRTAPSPAPNKAAQKSPAPAKQNTPSPAPTPSPQPQRQPTPAPTPAPSPSPSPQPSPSPSPSPMPTARPSPSPSPTPAPTPARTPQPSPSPSPMPQLFKNPFSPSPAPTPSARPSATPSPMPTMAPSPMARGAGSGLPTPTPTARPTGGFAGLPSAAPSPVAIAMGSGGAPGALPMPKMGSSPGGGFFSSAPAPIAPSGGTGGGGASGPPSVVPVAAAGGGRGGGSRSASGGGPSGAPAPTRSSGGSFGGGGGPPGIVVLPSVPRGGGGPGGGPSSGSSSGDNQRGNPDPNGNPNGRPSMAAQADVDFGPYMADLQRRIKKHWFPPKGNESKRVMVIFKIHSDGTMSNLRLDRGSGVAVADKAALDAVENAAPFRPLPAGAPPDVDIQFTFDYNVFGGSGRGSFRQF